MAAASCPLVDAGLTPTTADPSRPALPGRGPLWRLNVIVFIASACTMVLELVGGRIIAPYVGVSLYTSTTVIGVVLAGISAGNCRLHPNGYCRLHRGSEVRHHLRRRLQRLLSALSPDHAGVRRRRQ